MATVRGGAFAIAAMASLAAQPARATATLTCDIEDPVVTFHVMATVGHEATSVSGTRGELRLRRAGRTIVLEADHLVATWIEGDELRLRFHVFAEGDGYDTDLVIVTRRRTETDYAGRYRLRTGEKRDHARRGKVACALG
ncbi:hypothetical protein [Pinisolibacter sp.]|uniref:hypothetical protein n=1 Tax=Pinisolibacter sp. TaxID=2172024 RepID=UPI002FDEEDA4